MKLLKLTSKFLIAVLFFSLVQSCGSKEAKEVKEIKDEQLSSFMLGGAYFINGYGGTEAVKNQIKSAGYTTPDKIVLGYKELLEFPYEKSDKAGVIRTFKSMWNINNKQDLLKTIEDLKTKDNKYKAWDFARIVNNTALGYAADYLTKKEVLQINSEILPLAKEKYSNWTDYFTDFIKGRKEWNPDDSQLEEFEKVSKTITTGEDSIYKLLPLNVK